MPEGSVAGNAGTFGQPGALGMGQRAATALTLFNSFWSYIMPILVSLTWLMSLSS